MPCPRCLEGKSAIVSSRPTEAGHIKRRRQCATCSYRWTTWESDVDPNTVRSLSKADESRIRFLDEWSGKVAASAAALKRSRGL